MQKDLADEEKLAREAQEQGGTGTAEDLNPGKHLESLRKQETSRRERGDEGNQMRSKKGVEIRQGLELSLRTLCLILRDRICCTFAWVRRNRKQERETICEAISKESWSPVGRMTKRTHCAEDGGGHWFILTLERGQGDGTGPGETEAAQVGEEEGRKRVTSRKYKPGGSRLGVERPKC